ncbi:MAG: type II secretion system inner membrane protein GspF [Pseudomonadales bacterium]|nr:type II secretion system inner membrane protein GspF [Pseudomonadales bacterium]
MAAFEYQALDEAGRTRKGVIEADSARHARALLRDQALMPTKVNVTASQSTIKRSGVSFQRKLGHLDRVLFTRQLATLIGSSLPIEAALAAVAEQAEKQHVKGLIMAIRSKVLEGHSLAVSLSDHSSSFNALYRATVTAGEQSGFLDKVLENLADYEERQFSATRNVEMAMVYPAVLLTMAVLIISGLMVYIVPDMVNVIVDTGQELPWFTTVLIGITDLMANYWWLLIIAVALSVLCIRWLLAQPRMRLRWDRMKFDMPLIQRITRSANAARYTNTLSILTRSGVPLVEAMHIASGVVSNQWLQRALTEATQRVSEGISLHISLGKVGQMPPMLLHMVAAGEQSGTLDAMLGRVADFQQSEVERVVSALVKLFEPLMLLMMGGVVLFIVMAILLPMLSMNQLV